MKATIAGFSLEHSEQTGNIKAKLASAAIREDVQCQRVSVMLTPLTDGHGGVPPPVGCALGSVVASQGETFMAGKANGVLVPVAIFINRYPPVLDLWGWTYHL